MKEGGGDKARYDKRITKREMVEKLKSLKAEVKYSEYPGVAHNSWDNAFAERVI